MAPEANTSREPATRAGKPPGTFRLAAVAGIAVYIHWSWPIAAMLIAWLVGGSYLPDAYPEWSDRATAFVALTAAALFFGSILLHEFGHALVARRLGYPVESVTLYLLGGAAGIHSDAKRPRDEFFIAGIGPGVSAALAIAGAAVWAFAPGPAYVTATAGYLAFANGALAVFNMLPGLPLDGGRVLRAAIWAKSKSSERSTRWAARAGQGLGVVLLVGGVADLALGSAIGGVWTMLIGWFIWNAARVEGQRSTFDQSIEGLRVDEAMEREVYRLAPDATIRDLATNAAGLPGARAFIVGPDGTNGVLGMVTLTDLERTPRETWSSVSVYRAMTPVDRLATVAPDVDVKNAMQLMVARGVQQLPVFRGRDLVGLVSRQSILRAAKFRERPA